MQIVNLTQHAATPEQIAEGVVDLPEAARAALTTLLTVDDLPSREQIAARCAAVTKLALEHCPETDEDDSGYTHHAMIGGAPWMMASLEAFLFSAGIRPRYAFSKRECVESAQADGTVRKTMVFRHAGWVPAG